MKQYYVYIMASGVNGTLYIGVTSDLVKRVWEHKQKTYQGFTEKYTVDQLVYYEEGADIERAIAREKCLKRYKRAWKLQLIADFNPNWIDLYDNIAGFADQVGE